MTFDMAQAERNGQALREAACEILETMFFTPAEGTESPEGWVAPLAGASVMFRGAKRGRFEIQLESQLAGEMAASFLGVMDPDEMRPDQLSQVTRELANMICGATLSRMAPGAIFDLDAPCLLEDPSQAVAGPGCIVEWLDSGQGLIRLALEGATDEEGAP